MPAPLLELPPELPPPLPDPLLAAPPVEPLLEPPLVLLEPPAPLSSPEPFPPEFPPPVASCPLPQAVGSSKRITGKTEHLDRLLLLMEYTRDSYMHRLRESIPAVLNLVLCR